MKRQKVADVTILTPESPRDARELERRRKAGVLDPGMEERLHPWKKLA